MHEHALRSFQKDLASLPTGGPLTGSSEESATGTGAVGAEAVDDPALGWEQVEASLPRTHAVPGGLSRDERRELIEETLGACVERSGEPMSEAKGVTSSRPVRVDVADLGLTMDDLMGPMGGLG